VAPHRFLSHRPETNAKKEGKEFVKFVDGLGNVAGKCAPAHRDLPEIESFGRSFQCFASNA
jgi:hypothetical protein